MEVARDPIPSSFSIIESLHGMIEALQLGNSAVLNMQTISDYITKTLPQEIMNNFGGLDHLAGILPLMGIHSQNLIRSGRLLDDHPTEYDLVFHKIVCRLAMENLEKEVYHEGGTFNQAYTELKQLTGASVHVGVIVLIAVIIIFILREFSIQAQAWESIVHLGLPELFDFVREFPQAGTGPLAKFLIGSSDHTGLHLLLQEQALYIQNDVFETAVEDGHVSLLQLLFEYGPHCKVRPLYDLAIKKGRADVVKFFLEETNLPNYPSPLINCPDAEALFRAYETGVLEVIEVLIAHPRVLAEDLPLAAVISRGEVEVLRLFDQYHKLDVASAYQSAILRRNLPIQMYLMTKMLTGHLILLGLEDLPRDISWLILETIVHLKVFR